MRLIETLKQEIEVLNMKIDVELGSIQRKQTELMELEKSTADLICDRDERKFAIYLLEEKL